jgi:hypothetical protein
VSEGKPEGPYDASRTDGVDALVTSLEKAGIKPNANVYAELGSTWRFLSMRKPDEAAHVLSIEEGEDRCGRTDEARLRRAESLVPHLRPAHAAGVSQPRQLGLDIAADQVPFKLSN